MFINIYSGIKDLDEALSLKIWLQTWEGWVTTKYTIKVV